MLGPNFVTYEFIINVHIMFSLPGNDNLHVLTSQGNYQLRIDLWDWNEITTHAIYSTFKVGAGNTLYKLTIGGYSGDAGKVDYDYRFRSIY